MATASVITCNVYLDGLEDHDRIIKVDSRAQSIDVCFRTASGEFRRVTFEKSEIPVGVEFDGSSLTVYRRSAKHSF